MSKLRAIGKWALIEIIAPPTVDGMQVSKGGIFLPPSNDEEKRAFGKGRVLSVGKGDWDDKKRRYKDPGFKEGDTVIFRGFLSDVWKASYLSDSLCFMHVDDVLGHWDAGASIAGKGDGETWYSPSSRR
jgi:co-chaperonin GroES (HSP10)